MESATAATITTPAPAAAAPAHNGNPPEAPEAVVVELNWIATVAFAPENVTEPLDGVAT